jgi:hypothetical protein
MKKECKMSITSVRPRSFNPLSSLKLRINPAMVLGAIILTALIAFEAFNYSTTDYALRDLLGDLKFAGIPWATILTIAFCGIDFAGIARLFTPEHGADEPKEVWYLFGAWLLAATMNAMLTWWGVSMAIVNHSVKSTAVVDQNTLIKVVPVFIAIMVWVIRILIIGSLSVAGDRLIWGKTRQSSSSSPIMRSSMSPSGSLRPASSMNTSGMAARPSSAARPMVSRLSASESSHPEPTYHNMSVSPRPIPRSSAGDPKSGSSTLR